MPNSYKLRAHSNKVASYKAVSSMKSYEEPSDWEGLAAIGWLGLKIPSLSPEGFQEGFKTAQAPDVFLN